MMAAGFIMRVLIILGVFMLGVRTHARRTPIR
jgi:hypothetical protein